jgi:hypothetical protein
VESRARQFEILIPTTELLGFGWDGVEGTAEVAFAEVDAGVGVVGDFDAEGVHARGGVSVGFGVGCIS